MSDNLQALVRLSDTERLDALERVPYQLCITFRMSEPRTLHTPTIRSQIDHFIREAKLIKPNAESEALT